MNRYLMAQMNMLLYKAQCASKQGLRLIFIEASKNKK